jgi:protein phosphatase
MLLPADRFDFRDVTGPFDIIGDVHGCADELHTLLERLGYAVTWLRIDGTVGIVAPPGRRLLFAGDLVDRGPHSPEALRIVMAAVAAGICHCVRGNHDDKLQRALLGRPIRVAHGLTKTLRQLDEEAAPFVAEVKDFLAALPAYLWLDGGRLVVSHAGIRAEMIGRIDGRTRSFCMYGDTDGTTDADGLPLRRDWAATYRGDTAIVYGHTPVTTAIWRNGTINIDTGCVYGGALTALRWPEREIVSVPALRAYATHRRGLLELR